MTKPKSTRVAYRKFKDCKPIGETEHTIEIETPNRTIISAPRKEVHIQPKE